MRRIYRLATVVCGDEVTKAVEHRFAMDGRDVRVAGGHVDTTMPEDLLHGQEVCTGHA